MFFICLSVILGLLFFRLSGCPCLVFFSWMLLLFFFFYKQALWPFANCLLFFSTVHGFGSHAPMFEFHSPPTNSSTSYSLSITVLHSDKQTYNILCEITTTLTLLTCSFNSYLWETTDIPPLFGKDTEKVVYSLGYQS